MQRITHVTVLPGHQLQLRFTDGAEGIVDLSDLVGHGVFESWKDESTFAKVTINQKTGTVCWPGGIDLCPDSLYAEITGQSLDGRTVA